MLPSLAMKALPVLGLLALVACSHDDKPAQTTPDVAVEPASTPVASGTPTAAPGTPPPADSGSGHSACDAVRCRGGMVCKMVNGTPTCVAQN